MSNKLSKIPLIFSIVIFQLFISFKHPANTLSSMLSIDDLTSEPEIETKLVI